MPYDGAGGVRRPWTQPEYKYCGSGFEQVLSERESSGLLTMRRTSARPEDAPPLHYHTREDEFVLVLSGRMRFWIGGAALRDCTVSEGKAGAFAYAPREVPHTFQTITPDSEILIGNCPGAIECYFRSEADTDRDEDRVAVMASYGCHILAAPPVWGDWN